MRSLSHYVDHLAHEQRAFGGMDGRLDDAAALLIPVRTETLYPFTMAVLIEEARDGWQRNLAVAHYGHVGLHHLVYLNVVDVEVYDFSLLGVRIESARVAIAETHTNGYYYVSFLRQNVRSQIAVHAEHTHIEGMVGGQG